MMFTPIEEQQINNLFKKVGKNTEFEVMFNNYKKENPLSLHSFMDVMKYLKYKNVKNKLKLTETISLDISYSGDPKNIFRATIYGQENINNFLSLVHQRENNMIMSIFISQYLDKEGYELMKKEKDNNNIVDVDNHDIRFRLSKEIPVEDEIKLNLLKLPLSQAENIVFRYKNRLSLELEKNINIDMTIVRCASNINKLNTSDKVYELEIDYSLPNNEQKYIKMLLKEIEIIKKILVNNNTLIKNTDKEKIIINYKNLVYGSDNLNFNNLYTMQPVSAEIQHFIDYIPNKYAITDKADGEKYQLFINNNNMYLINSNLNVTSIGKTEVSIKDTIIEGEYFMGKDRKFIFMGFDCLYYDGKDVRDETNLKTRVDYIYKVFEKIFPKNKFYKMKDYKGDFKLDKIKSHYNNEIIEFYDNLETLIKNNKNYVFHPKLYFYPTGGNNSEVFLFSDLLWTNITKNSKVKCPYSLDGIIFTGLEQKYTRDMKQHKLPTYKYKPPHLNSIDFYITFDKNVESGQYLDVFDNSLPNSTKNDYRITNLYVGERIGSTEKPVEFMPQLENNIALFPIVNGNVRDIEGNIVQSNTVVEVVYNTESTLPHKYKWSILRTRWDKTESIIRDKKKYGNYKTVAEKVWKSIKESITINEIANLADSKTYGLQMNILKSRLDSSVIISQRQQDKYYQKVTNLIKKMREFHNWLKSIIIYTYASPIRDSIEGKEKRQSMLDIGCGRGGDILKSFHARVGEYVGFDVDYEGIYSATDGAISRFKYFKKKYPGFGKVSFLQADGGVKLTVEEQEKALVSLSDENKNLIKKIFTKDRKFDILNSQFVIHYLFANQNSINNLIYNIKSFLKKDGYMLITMFDADRVHKQFNNGKITSTYTDEDGNRQILYEIVKKYDGELNNDIGQAIDVHQSWINDEGKYIQEYLVTKELMISTMEKAGCRLIETDLFENLYIINKPYFENVVQYEENPNNKKFYEKVGSFYQDLKGADRESKQYSFLNRYYVFQKN